MLGGVNYAIVAWVCRPNSVAGLRVKISKTLNGYLFMKFECRGSTKMK